MRASLGEEVVVLDTVPHSFSRENVNKGVQRLVLHESIRKPTSGTRQSTAGTAVAHSSKASSSAATPTSKRHAAEDGDAIHEEDEAKNFQEANSRNPDKGLAFFINIDDDVPVGHPRGEYPYENERGIVLVRLLKKLFSIIPSECSPFYAVVVRQLIIFFVYFIFGQFCRESRSRRTSTSRAACTCSSRACPTLRTTW